MAVRRQKSVWRSCGTARKGNPHQFEWVRGCYEVETKRLLSASGPARVGQRDGDGKAGRRCAVYIDDLLAEILMGRVQAWAVAQ